MSTGKPLPHDSAPLHVTGEARYPLQARIRDVAVAPDGAVMLLTDAADGALLRLTPKG